jgi:hypothetical protein
MFAMKRSSSFLSSSLFSTVAATALSTTLFACVIEDAPPRRLAPDPAPSSPEPPSAGAIGGGSGSGSDAPTAVPTTPGSPSPILVLIDTDQVMNADPGQGVGVFTEYSAGGKWHVWWTCDTAISKQDCDVAVSATAAAGNISNVDSAELQGGTVVTPTPSRVEANVKTTNQVHGIKFTTNPGAVITLEATIGGLKEGPGPNRSFFFFVQDGKINGGFGGTLTNPLQLQGNKP